MTCKATYIYRIPSIIFQAERFANYLYSNYTFKFQAIMDIDELKTTVDSMGNLLITDEEFHEAAATVGAVSNLSDEQRLQMYGLFKTVTVGAVNTSRPWGVDFVGCAKW